MNKKSYRKVPLEVSVQLRVLHNECGLGVAELQKRFPGYPKTSIYRHMKKTIGDVTPDRRHHNKGAAPKLTARNVLSLKRGMSSLMENVGTFSSTELQEECGLKQTCSNRTVRRTLKRLGYGYYQCRKKGQLTAEDLKKRVAFCKKCKKLPENFWTEGISFYLDGTGWVHKTNPSKSSRTTRTRMWRKKGDGLKREYTAKGKKEGCEGRMARFMVAICHGKGVIKCHRYEGKMNGEKFKEFVQGHFPEMFKMGNNSRGKLFLQDGDPSQNSKVVMDAVEKIPCQLFSIPPRSPDLNPIENIFHLAGKALKKDALNRNIVKETYEQFTDRIKHTLLNFSSDTISRTIASMSKRIDAIIKAKGQRIKY